jgi:uncharacterized membrane protein
MVRMKQNWDIAVSVLLGFFTALLIVTLPDWQSPVRIILGLVTVLLLPGYVLTLVLFPKKTDVAGVERLALTLGLSVAVVPQLSFILNYTPFGIRLYPATMTLLGFVLLMSGLALVRRRRVSEAERFSVELSRPVVRANLIGLFCLGIVLLIVGNHATYLRTKETFTEFYALGAGGRLEDYPDVLHPRESFTLTLGVINHENQAVNYSLVTPGKEDSIAIHLDDQQQWEQALSLVMPEVPAGRNKLNFDLYRAGEDTPYRQLHLFVTVPASQPLE